MGHDERHDNMPQKMKYSDFIRGAELLRDAFVACGQFNLLLLIGFRDQRERERPQTNSKLQTYCCHLGECPKSNRFLWINSTFFSSFWTKGGVLDCADFYYNCNSWLIVANDLNRNWQHSLIYHVPISVPNPRGIFLRSINEQINFDPVQIRDLHTQSIGKVNLFTARSVFSVPFEIIDTLPGVKSFRNQATRGNWLWMRKGRDFSVS